MDSIFIKLKKIKKLNWSKDEFIKILLIRIWEFIYNNYIDYLADIDYGYCITVHKSQGSTFDNVFLDLNNIVKYNYSDKKQCVYTGITRTSKMLNILK